MKNFFHTQKHNTEFSQEETKKKMRLHLVEFYDHSKYE